MDYKDSDPKKMEVAVSFARMYGVKETLESLPYISNEEIVVLIEKWTEEYLDIEKKEIVSFFESRFYDNGFYNFKF